MLVTILAVVGWVLAVVGWGLLLLTLWAWRRFEFAAKGRSAEEIVREHGGIRKAARALAKRS